MTTFPFPLPTASTEPQPPADLGGGVEVTYRCAPEVAPFVQPVLDRFRQYREAGQVEDGLRTMVGFGPWRLRQDGPAQYAITAPDYANGDLVEGVTDDLTLAAWIEASQADVVRRADVAPEPTDLSQGVVVTRAALDAVDRGHADELVLVRRPATSETDSGWLVRTAEESTLRNEEVEILAGLLVQTAPRLVPFLTLPTGTVVRVAGDRFLGAWQTGSADGTVGESDPRLLDADGHGTSVGERVQCVVNGVTLRAYCHPNLVPLAEGILDAFADGGEPPTAGGGLQSMYSPFMLEESREGSVLLVTTPDFSSHENYRSRTTNDLTAALVAEAGQIQTARRAGFEPDPTLVSETVAIEERALAALVRGEDVPFLMERFAHGEGHGQRGDGAQRSGWMISTPVARTDEEMRLLNIDAGEVHACDDLFTPYFGMPTGSYLSFRNGQLTEAHLLDRAKLHAAMESGEYPTLQALFASRVASQPLFSEDGSLV